MMRQEGKRVSIAQLCQWFGVPRSTFYYRGERHRARELDRGLVELVGRLIAANPDYGLRRLTVLVRRELREAVNRKRIHRILKANGGGSAGTTLDRGGALHGLAPPGYTPKLSRCAALSARSS